MTQPTEDYAATNRRITTISLGVAVVLVTLKAFAFGASGSVSIMASLTDSALDLAATLGTFLAVRWSMKSANDSHRYGRGKAESLSALVQAGLVMASALFIGIAAIKRTFAPAPVTSGGVAIVVMAISMAITGWLVWQQSKAVKKTGSVAITADRAHFSADLAANAVVMIGLASGALLRAPVLDALAGLIVAIWLGWGAFGLLKTAFAHLMDAAAPADVRSGITAVVLDDPRIFNVHQLRTRISGPTLMVQMHVDIDAGLSFVEAHDIVVAAEKRILAQFPHADLIIHADPAPASSASAAVMPEPLADIPQSPRTSGPWG